MDNNFDTIVNEINGALDNDNIASDAAIALSKLAAAAWTTWTTTYGGFSADPSQTLLYIKIGRMVTVFANAGTAGTSDATTYTMTLPYAAVAEVRIPIFALDDTSTTSVGRATTAASSTTLSLFTSIGGTGWTASGTKLASFCFSYPSTS